MDEPDRRADLVARRASTVLTGDVLAHRRRLISHLVGVGLYGSVLDAEQRPCATGGPGSR
jgi:hypothetical protein